MDVSMDISMAHLQIKLPTYVLCLSIIFPCLSFLFYRVVQKTLHKVYGTVILQPYIIESCGFQQNVLKEILYMTEVSV